MYVPLNNNSLINIVTLSVYQNVWCKIYDRKNNEMQNYHYVTLLIINELNIKIRNVKKGKILC